jgi:hypothetical protein
MCYVDTNLNTEEVKDVVHTRVHAQPKTLFADDIKGLVDQSNEYVEKLGDYIKKKKTVYLFCVTFIQQKNNKSPLHF